MTRREKFVRFLDGKCGRNEFIVIDPSSYVGEFFSKETRDVTFEDVVDFYGNFETDSWISCLVSFEEVIPELRWSRTLLKDEGSEKFYEEEIVLHGGKRARRVIGTRHGLIDQRMEGPIRGDEDFGLIDYYTDMISSNFGAIESAVVSRVAKVDQIGHLPSAVLLIPFECYYLIEYKDMPVFYHDFHKRYHESMDKILELSLKLVDFLSGLGVEVFIMGSAGFELLSPRIFEEAIIPYVSKITARVRQNRRHSVYHICGHSRDIIESGMMNRIGPDVYEGCSTPPCGNITGLRKTLACLSENIISKGNLPLQVLRNATPGDIRDYVEDLSVQTKKRRHIFGQADATILPGTPRRNIEAFINSVRHLVK